MATTRKTASAWKNKKYPDIFCETPKDADERELLAEIERLQSLKSGQ